MGAKWKPWRVNGDEVSRTVGRTMTDFYYAAPEFFQLKTMGQYLVPLLNASIDRKINESLYMNIISNALLPLCMRILTAILVSLLDVCGKRFFAQKKDEKEKRDQKSQN